MFEYKIKFMDVAIRISFKHYKSSSFVAESDLF